MLVLSLDHRGVQLSEICIVTVQEVREKTLVAFDDNRRIKLSL